MVKIAHTVEELDLLLDACKHGDDKAFEAIYTRFNAAMYNTALRICGNSDDAQDVVQDSFVAAFKSLKNLKKQVVFSAWLRSIVINRSLDQLRQRRKVVFVDIVDQADNTDAMEQEEEEPDYTVNDIQLALAQLPDGFRIVLTLYLFEDISHKEIASRLSISEGTSKSQYARAKKKLIQIIKSNIKSHA